MQTTMKKRETTKFPLGTPAGTGAQDMKEEDTVKKIDPSAFSTVRKERRTTMSKLVKQVAPFCSIHDVYIKNLAKEYDFGLEENLKWKWYFVQAKLLYNIRKGQKMVIRSTMGLIAMIWTTWPTFRRHDEAEST